MQGSANRDAARRNRGFDHPGARGGWLERAHGTLVIEAITVAQVGRHELCMALAGNPHGPIGVSVGAVVCARARHGYGVVHAPVGGVDVSPVAARKGRAVGDVAGGMRGAVEGQVNPDRFNLDPCPGSGRRLDWGFVGLCWCWRKRGSKTNGEGRKSEFLGLVGVHGHCLGVEDPSSVPWNDPGGRGNRSQQPDFGGVCVQVVMPYPGARG